MPVAAAPAPPCRRFCRDRLIQSARLRAEREVDMPENYTSRIVMVVVLVAVCGVVGAWALRSRRRNATMASPGRQERRDTTLEHGRTS